MKLLGAEEETKVNIGMIRMPSIKKTGKLGPRDLSHQTMLKALEWP